MHDYMSSLIKKYGFLLFSCIFSFKAFAQIRSDKDLLGKWEGAGTQLQFFSDKHVSMIARGGKLPLATYKADYMQNPIVLTITLTDNGQTINYKVKLQFINNETIQAEYMNGESNDVFEKGRQLQLKKIK
jgi:hypothetical protein